MKLTRRFRDALHAVKHGADVTGYQLATDLRALQKVAPELIWIGDVMGHYDVREKLPYFGAVATPADKRALKAFDAEAKR